MTEFDAERALCEAIVAHQYPDTHSEGRLVVDVQKLLEHYNAAKGGDVAISDDANELAYLRFAFSLVEPLMAEVAAYYAEDRRPYFRKRRQAAKDALASAARNYCVAMEKRFRPGAA